MAFACHHMVVEDLLWATGDPFPHFYRNADVIVSYVCTTYRLRSSGETCPAAHQSRTTTAVRRLAARISSWHEPKQRISHASKIAVARMYSQPVCLSLCEAMVRFVCSTSSWQERGWKMAGQALHEHVVTPQHAGTQGFEHTLESLTSSRRNGR